MVDTLEKPPDTEYAAEGHHDPTRFFPYHELIKKLNHIVTQESKDHEFAVQLLTNSVFSLFKTRKSLMYHENSQRLEPLFLEVTDFMEFCTLIHKEMESRPAQRMFLSADLLLVAARIVKNELPNYSRAKLCEMGFEACTELSDMEIDRLPDYYRAKIYLPAPGKIRQDFGHLRFEN